MSSCVNWIAIQAILAHSASSVDLAAMKAKGLCKITSPDDNCGSELLTRTCNAFCFVFLCKVEREVQ